MSLISLINDIWLNNFHDELHYFQIAITIIIIQQYYLLKNVDNLKGKIIYN